jgi:hypothetical protein
MRCVSSSGSGLRRICDKRWNGCMALRPWTTVKACLKFRGVTGACVRFVLIAPARLRTNLTGEEMVKKRSSFIQEGAATGSRRRAWKGRLSFVVIEKVSLVMSYFPVRQPAPESTPRGRHSSTRPPRRGSRSAPGDWPRSGGSRRCLHPWSQTVGSHDYLHCIVTGGGVTRDARRWVPMECGLTGPARAGRQGRRFALHPPWSPGHFLFPRRPTAHGPPTS